MSNGWKTEKYRGLMSSAVQYRDQVDFYGRFANEYLDVEKSWEERIDGVIYLLQNMKAWYDKYDSATEHATYYALKKPNDSLEVEAEKAKVLADIRAERDATRALMENTRRAIAHRIDPRY